MGAVNEKSDALKELEALLQAHEAKQPGSYTSLWQQELQGTLESILNRDQFRYDPSGDALYRQYQSLYENQGRLAMQDASGQAAALTGGYGNSYAASVGQQAYQQSLQQLGEKLPQLYSLALQRYNAEGGALNDRYSLLRQQENAAYTRYREDYTAWQNQQKALQERIAAQREADYNRYATDRDYDYRLQRDEIEDRRWQKEFEEAVRQFNVKRGIKT